MVLKIILIYAGNSCLKSGNVPPYMSPVQGGSLLSIMKAAVLPPALAPFPILDGADVVEPPLPPAIKPSITAPPTSQPSAGHLAAVFALSWAIAMLTVSLLLL